MLKFRASLSTFNWMANWNKKRPFNFHVKGLLSLSYKFHFSFLEMWANFIGIFPGYFDAMD